MPCKHPDIRQFDGVRCCLACGEAVFERRQQHPTSGAGLEAPLGPIEYRYDDLSSALGQEIRLVVLLPGKPSDPVAIDIVHAALGEMDFDALSYTWATDSGNDEKSQIIHHVDGYILYVTINCEHALRQLRDPTKERRLWVDAISINQSVIEERNHQVGKMDLVFSSAQCVVMFIPYPAYLSGWGPDAQHALFEPLFVWLHRPVEDVYLRNRVQLEEALKLLLQSRYFTRAWVLQEVALASRLLLRYGAHEAELFFPILHRIRQSYKTPPALNWDPGLARTADVATCLQAGLRCEARDPRDKIFAVLSLMEPRARSLVTVNYSLMTPTVYCNAIIAIVVTDRSLDILIHIPSYPAPESTNALVKLDDRLTVHDMEDLLSNYTSRKGGRLQLSQGVDKLWQSVVNIEIVEELDAHATMKPALLMHQKDIHMSTAYCAPTAHSLNGTASIMPRFRVRAHLIDTVTRTVPGKILTPFTGRSLLRTPFLFPWIWRYFSLDSMHEETKSSRSTLFYADGTPRLDLDESINQDDLDEFARSVASYPQHDHFFETHYSVGHVHVGSGGDSTPDLPGVESSYAGNAVFAVDGVSIPLILHETSPGEYGIMASCHLWAALELDYWNPGTKKGRWGTRHHDHGCEQTRMITIW